MTDPIHPPRHVGTAAVIGRPNAGKSTLLNRILGGKLAIVSSKPQTTRDRIVGVYTSEQLQLVITDTPGWHKAWSELNKVMVARAEAALQSADLAIWVEDAAFTASRIRAGEDILDHNAQAIAELLNQAARRVIVVLNKVDKIERTSLLPMIEAMQQSLQPKDFIPISAKTGDGIPQLLEAICQVLPKGDLLYPPEHWTDVTERFLAAEAIREQVFLLTKREVPYATHIEIESFDETRRHTQNIVVISATVVVERTSQKPIIIGKGGDMIKRIGTAARQELTELLDCRVHLELFVKVEPDWTKTVKGVTRAGYKS